MKTEITGDRFVKNTQHPLKITGLERVNILFGKNGTGKSTFLQNIYKTQSNDFHLVVPERGGGNMLYQSNIFDQENKENERKSVRSKNYDGQYRERSISRTASILSSLGHKTYVKKEVVEETLVETIEALFGVFLPEFIAKFSGNQPYSIEFYRSDENNNSTKITDTTQLSSGQVEALSLAADIVTQAVLWRNEKKCILVDEPDAHLHLDLQNRFAIFIEEVSRKFDIQFIITTHSQALLASLMNVCDSIGIVCLDSKKEEIKAIQKNDNFIFSNLLSSDLALSKVIGRKIVIVEGNDDFLVWNQAARNQNFDDIAIIEAGGGDILQYKTYTEKILNAISDDASKAGITLTDRDKKEDTTHDTNSILPIQRLQCYSIENLLLTNEVLHSIKSDIDLNVELDSISSSSPEDKVEIDKIKTDKKGTKISKDLIKKIHNKIDTHSNTADWRIRVGKVLGKARPTGELLDFLGNDVVNYIWGEVNNTETKQ
jgi:predicted ATP-dependent endonuclease of OLD family